MTRKTYTTPLAKTIALDAKAELLIGSTPDQFSRKKDAEFDEFDEKIDEEESEKLYFFRKMW